MRPINEIIVHCSATRKTWMQDNTAQEKVAEIRRWHVEDNKWADIGYHFVIDRDGTVVSGRPLGRTGAHVAGRNSGTIGICLIGGHGSTANDDPFVNFEPKQLEAAKNLIADLMADHPGITEVSGHNQYANKACPGFNVPHWFNVPKPPVDETFFEPETPTPAPSQLAALIKAILSLFGRGR